MNIRAATNPDREDIKGVYMCAFPEDEGETVANLAVDLLAEETMPQTISLVAEIDGVVVGHIAFSPVTVDKKSDFQGYLLAPLGIKSNYQKRRIGSKLIEYGIKSLAVMRVNIVFVYGAPQYYSRFGFSTDVAHQYVTPYRLQYPFGWQAIVLNECDIGKQSVAITCVNSLRDSKLW